MSDSFWHGVFPAITTQLTKDQSVDLDATARHAEALIDSGVSGIIFLGSLGENQALTANEKRLVIEAMVKIVNGRVPVLSGVAESSTTEACRYLRDVERLGVNGAMLMPAMLYRGDPRETLTHFRASANATGLPLMIYNNPISYANDITPEMFSELADEKNFVALKESSGNTRRITDIRNVVGDRFAIFTGVDDLALESAILGRRKRHRISGRKSILLGTHPLGRMGKGSRNLSLVFTTSPPRRPHQIRSIHQTRRPGMWPRL
jgi:dihydrodipicolinate synthase/N-acetylneuraminate lyase